jgi:hypothetical protein
MVSGGHGRIADTAAEVDATFRTQRRVVLAYFAVFLLVTLAVRGPGGPLVSATAPFVE